MELSTIDSQANLSILQSKSTDRALDAAKKYEEAKSSTDREAITKAAQEFESVFIYEMMKPMFESVDVDPVFGGGKGEEIFRGFILQEYGKDVAQNGGLGLQSAVMDALLKAQERSSAN